MPRRYSSKRLRGKLRKRKRSSLPHVDHSSKGLYFAKAIQRGLSRQQYSSSVSVQTNHISTAGHLVPNPPQLSATVMTPFATVFELSTNNTDQTPFFVPYHCLSNFGANDHEFLRHANMFTQYRIKGIRFEYVPTTSMAKGTVLPITSEYPYQGVSPSDVKLAMDDNQVNSSTVWLIKWPNKRTGLFQDFGGNLSNPSVVQLGTNLALNDPSVIKIPVTEKLVLSWKPRILGYKPVMFRTTNSSGQQSVEAQDNFLPAAKPFPWMNIVDNVENPALAGASEAIGVTTVSGTTGTAGPYSTTALRVQMSQPMIAMYNTALDTFITPETFSSTGRWFMHTIFEFRNKRDRMVGNGAVLQENDENYNGMRFLSNAEVVNTFSRV